MTWSSTNAVSATLTPGIGSVPMSGSRDVSPTVTTTYRVTVRNATGRTAGVTATVAVTPAPRRPPNDHFSNATRISGPSGRATGSNVNATVESGEPDRGRKSVWWRWQAPISGRLTVDTTGSNFDTILGVYTGSRVSSLRELAHNDDHNGALQSRVSLDVTAGTVYGLRGAGFDDGSEGSIVLNWNTVSGG